MANEVRGMHYDYKQKLNKIDSQQYRNLKVPEIDWKLNEALNVFIKRIAQPRTNPSYGFELNSRTTDDIRMLVVPNKAIATTPIGSNIAEGALPDDYLYYASAKCKCKKGDCEAEIPISMQKHVRDFENPMFVKSSFEWREVNGLFVGNNTHLYTDGSFDIEEIILNYIKKPLYIHNAEDAQGGNYYLPNGELLQNYQNCELDDSVYGEIVDLAVLITVGDLISDYKAKSSKIQLVNN